MACREDGSHKLSVNYLLNKESEGGSDKRGSAGSSSSAERPYRCEHCDGSFRVKGDLFKHTRNVHLKEKRFECSICHRQFSERGNLNKHTKRVHQVDHKEHPCKEPGCSSEFATSDGLLRHMRQVHRIGSSSSSHHGPSRSRA